MTSTENDAFDSVREELVNTAVKFLRNPNVQKSAVEQRKSFLRKKGLSEKEILVAFDRALVPMDESLPSQSPANFNQHVVVPMPNNMLPPPLTGWARFRETVNNIALVSGIIYGLYILYKRYIAPFLFGTARKPAIEDSMKALDESVKTSVHGLRTELQKVQVDIEKISEHQEMARNHATAKQMQELKNEMLSLKGLLLNRKQFTPPTSELVPPSIPAWQLEGEQVGGGEKPEEEGESIGSEPEVVTNNGSNGSDSSLEMIKES